MSEFAKFAHLIKQRFDELSKHELYTVHLDPDVVYQTYLASFPEGTNPIYRERTEHDCSCCRNFIKNLGSVVAIIDGKLQSVWTGMGAEYPYNVVAEALAELVENTAIEGIFRTAERSYGAASTNELLDNGKVKTWNHFYGVVASRHFSKQTTQVRGEYATTVAVFKRGLDELKPESFQTVLDLIAAKNLYRGEEFLTSIQQFQTMQQLYLSQPSYQLKELFVWTQAGSMASRFRNTAIGTLVQDLSEGKELEAAVRSFESKVAPTNYKRTTALITPAMIKQAMDTINEMGLESALERRFAKLSDVSVNNVLWVDNSVQGQMKGGIEALLMDAVVKTPAPAPTQAEDIGIEDFMSNVLPLAKSMSVFVKGSMQNQFMSLTAPVHADVRRIFKWDNDFAWSYNGNITDSEMRKAVQARGGRVDGVFRFTHSWNQERRNTSLMDLHVFLPGSSVKAGNVTDDHYGNSERVGWNHRQHHATGGVQDVDYTLAAPVGYVPVENITFPDLSRMPEGTYTCKIHNWQWRTGTVGGFKAEIEFAGQVFEYNHPEPLKNKEWVTVAEVTLKNGQFSIKHHLTPSFNSVNVWGVDTEQFVKVNTLMFSPNHWDGQKIGNKHWFFILDGCRNNEPTRGIYNEFLNSELDKHRKVFEVLGARTMCQPTDEQLSGLGFSSTRGDTVVVQVQGDKYRKLFNISF